MVSDGSGFFVDFIRACYAEHGLINSKDDRKQDNMI